MRRQGLLHPDTATALAGFADAHPNHTDLQRHCARGIANVAALPQYPARVLLVLPTLVRMLGVSMATHRVTRVDVHEASLATTGNRMQGSPMRKSSANRYAPSMKLSRASANQRPAIAPRTQTVSPQCQV
jgi:hypothetical protein